MITLSSPECLLTHDPQASALWEKLCRLSFDRGTGPRTFARRLAGEQGWSESFTALAIEEYRRFLLLFALDKQERSDASDGTYAVRIVPSSVVDKVWHLHLLYTQSYWEDLCRDILAGPLHHIPSDGSGGESAKLDTVYEATLAAYRRAFGRTAPVSVWPVAMSSGSSTRRGAPADTGSTRAFAGVAALVGVGVLVTALLALGHFVPPGLFVLAALVGLGALGIASGRRQTGGRKRSDGGSGGDGGGFFGGDVSSGTGGDAHHDEGHHGGGSHDGGGHSHSCGGGHSCGGHGCGGGCGGH